MLLLLLLKEKLERDDINLREGERGACGVMRPFEDVGGVWCAGLAHSNAIQSKIANYAKGKISKYDFSKTWKERRKICKTSLDKYDDFYSLIL